MSKRSNDSSDGELEQMKSEMATRLRIAELEEYKLRSTGQTDGGHVQARDSPLLHWGSGHGANGSDP